jgi:hypothetical protein
MSRKVRVEDSMQSGYEYFLSESQGCGFDARFTPDLAPSEMLRLGVFGGVYLRDCTSEFPSNWFDGARFSLRPEKDIEQNYFRVDASLSLAEWKRKGWLHSADPRGWFQWYCRYYMGRRLPEEDRRQMDRWRAIRRHAGAIRKHCEPGDCNCRRKQRQALLHWAYDSRVI